MTSPQSSFKADCAQQAARMLLNIGAVHFQVDPPFTLASGKKAPTYVDCRKLISYPRTRTKLMDMLAETIERETGYDAFTNVAGGETAGIPFAAFIAERLNLPMTYVRKKPKGYGRNARIEGVMSEADRTILVEDLTTDGGSKFSFIDAIRETGSECTATAVIFYYGIHQGVEDKLADYGVSLHYLCTWWDVLAEAKAMNSFAPEVLTEVEAFLNDPAGWQASHAD